MQSLFDSQVKTCELVRIHTRARSYIFILVTRFWCRKGDIHVEIARLKQELDVKSLISTASSELLASRMLIIDRLQAEIVDLHMDQTSADMNKRIAFEKSEESEVRKREGQELKHMVTVLERDGAMLRCQNKVLEAAAAGSDDDRCQVMFREWSFEWDTKLATIYGELKTKYEDAVKAFADGLTTKQSDYIKKLGEIRGDWLQRGKEMDVLTVQQGALVQEVQRLKIRNIFLEKRCSDLNLKQKKASAGGK